MPTHEMTPLTESGALIALAVVLAILSAVVPVLGFFFLLAWPVPIAVLVCRHGVRWGILACLASGILLSMFLTPVGAAGIVLAYGLIGLGLGYAFSQGWSAARSYGFALVSGAIGQAASLGLVMALTGISPFVVSLEQLHQVVAESVAAQQEMGLPAAEVMELQEQMEAGLEIFAQMAPVLFCLIAVVLVSAAYFLTASTLRRLGTDAPTFPPFVEWRLPSAFAYLFGFAMVGIYWGGTREIDWLFQIAVAGELVALLAGMVQGFSLLSCLMEHFHMTGFWRYLLYFLIFINGLFLQILCLTGIFDMVFDYRKRFGKR